MTLVAPSFQPFRAPEKQNIDLSPVSTEVTIPQAVALLGMSEGCVQELLKVGVLQSKLEGTQRLINRDKLLEYKHKRERRLTMLDEMARIDQEMGLYDD